MSAAGASIAMTAERRCAATDDGVHHLAVLRGEMRSMPLDEAAAGYTEDAGHLRVGRLIASHASLKASPRPKSRP
jgi:hypothetical protein